MSSLCQRFPIPILLKFSTKKSSPALITRPCARRFIMSTHKQSKIDVLHNSLNYEKVGTGTHPILCLPGALGSIETDFRPQLSHLNPKLFTIVAWDPPGYGKSRPPKRNFSLGKEMFFNDARLAAALMKKLNFEKFSILGWSDGGITALILTALFPNSVQKMVVWGGNAFIAEKDIDIYKKIQNIDTWSPKMQAPMIETYGEEYFRQAWSDWVDCCVGIYAQGGDLCMQELSKITCPTLIIHGKQDPVVGMEHPAYLHKHINDSELVVMDEGKHNLHLRYYKEFNTLVEAFLLKKVA